MQNTSNITYRLQDRAILEDITYKFSIVRNEGLLYQNTQYNEKICQLQHMSKVFQRNFTNMKNNKGNIDKDQ